MIIVISQWRRSRMIMWDMRRGICWTERSRKYCCLIEGRRDAEGLVYIQESEVVMHAKWLPYSDVFQCKENRQSFS